MEQNKRNVCVFIKDNTQLSKAIDLLESFGEPICYNWLYRDAYLVFDPEEEGGWSTFSDWIFQDDGDGCLYIDRKNIVTLDRLEELLKAGSHD